jgi:hypothetical protein
MESVYAANSRHADWQQAAAINYLLCYYAICRASVPNRIELKYFRVSYRSFCKRKWLRNSTLIF